MSQEAFLRATDSTIAGLFVPAGLADTACWRSRDGTKSAEGVRVMVDRDTELMGSETGVITNAIVIHVFLGELGGFAGVGDQVTIGSTRFVVDRTLGRDESVARLSVREDR